LKDLRRERENREEGRGDELVGIPQIKLNKRERIVLYLGKTVERDVGRSIHSEA